MADAGAKRFTVLTRKALLKGLSPKKNREVPPLRYDDVYRLKAERSHLPIEINGGFKTLEHALEQLESVDAVMIGRASTDEPWIFSKADSMFFGASDPVSARRDVVLAHMNYLKEWQERGAKLPFLLAPMLNLFAGQRHARLWRRTLSEDARQLGKTPELLLETLDRVL